MNTFSISWLCVGYLGLLAILTSSCNTKQKTEPNYAFAIQENTEEAGPLAMRTTLDGESRIINLALKHNVTAAYSTTNLGVFKLWQGDLTLSGAVFDQKHGPQPSSQGTLFLDKTGEPNHYWQQNPNALSYLGHQVNANQVSLLYQAKGKLNGQAWQAEIRETPQASIDDTVLVYYQEFDTRELPNQAKLSLTLSSGALSREVQGAAQLVDNTLVLKKGVSRVISHFAPKFNEKSAPSPLNQQHPGLTLINNSDCAACHNPEIQTVGPSYRAIAQRYHQQKQAKPELIDKIIQGGSGNWGQVPMSAHPDLSKQDAAKMLEYILSLSVSESSQSSDILLGLGNPPITFTDQLPEYPSGKHGALIYQVGFANSEPDLSHGQQGTATLAAWTPQVHFSNTEHLGPQPENFMYRVKSHLDLQHEQTLNLRLVSDDGAYLYVNGERIIDNWGFHAPEAQDARLTLKAGLHPIEIIYFQAGGGGALSLQWKNPASGQYQVLPSTMLKIQNADIQPVETVVTDPDIVKSIPGDQQEVSGVHPSFTLSQARPDNFKPMVGGIDFFANGDMVVTTWDPEGSVYLVQNYDKPAQNIRVRRIARGLAEPLGVKVVDEEIYVLQKQELTRLVDSDKDGLIDRYEKVANNWSVTDNFHEFAFGLAFEDGHFYAALATAILPGGASLQPQAPSRGKVIKISKDTGKVTYLASGLRTPNGIGRGIDNQLFIADNQGDWVPACKIVELSANAWYGSRSVDFEGTAKLQETLPVVWLPQGEIGNSASQPTPLNIGPYQNQMLHGDVTHGGLKRVFAERVNGRLQGAVFRFSQGLEAGVNRLMWSPNGSLIVGGIGNPGNWAHGDKLWYGLQSLTYNHTSTFEMLEVSARSDGFEITLTEPIAEHRQIVPTDFEIQQWYYQATAAYGGPKKALENLEIEALTLSDDRRKIQLKLNGLKAEHLVYIRIKRGFSSTKDQALWTTEAWYTLNAIPENKPVTLNPNYQIMHNHLSETEKQLGWRYLFDGNSLGHFRNYNQKTLGKRWQVVDGTLYFAGRTPQDQGWQTEDGGDIIITPAPVENFELSLEWKVQKAGNSGIFYQVYEHPSLEFPFLSGTEMQILDNAYHPDGQIPTHRAGDNYDLIKSRFVTALPAMQWNHARIKMHNGKVEHWLNGYLVTQADMNSQHWQELVANSKFKDWPHFAKHSKGHILLQDHGDKVWFRNIKIRGL